MIPEYETLENSNIVSNCVVEFLGVRRERECVCVSTIDQQCTWSSKESAKRPWRHPQRRLITWQKTKKKKKIEADRQGHGEEQEAERLEFKKKKKNYFWR
jgi:hypothetical protein